MPNYNPEFITPRLLAYLKENIYQSFVIMNRRDWENVKISNLEQFEIDLEITPMSSIKNQNQKFGALAIKLTGYFIIKVYREDKKDEKPVNVDRYELIENISNIPDFLNIVQYASTSYDSNMESFVDECVILQKTKPDLDHHINYHEVPDLLRHIFLE